MGLFDSGSDIPEYQPYTGDSGLGSVTTRGNKVNVELDEKYQPIVRELLGGSPLSQGQLDLGAQATQQGAGFLNQLNADPFDIAEEQFNRMEAILGKGRDRQRVAQRENLLRTGRLGSTGGSLSEEGLEGAFETSRRANLAEAFGQAQGVQAQQAQIGQQLGAFGLGTEQAQLQRLLQSLGSAQATEAMPLQLANYLATLSGQRSQHQLGKAELEAAEGGMGDILSGALSAGIGAFTGGAGTAALAAATAK